MDDSEVYIIVRKVRERLTWRLTDPSPGKARALSGRLEGEGLISQDAPPSGIVGVSQVE